MADLSLPSAETGVLSRGETRSLGLRLSLSLATAACLLVAGAVQIVAPDQGDVTELIAGVGAALVAVPTLQAAWRSLREPNLHGIVDQLIALAVIAAWAAGDLLTAALLPLVMTVSHILEERSLLSSQEAVRALSRLTRTRGRRRRADGMVEEVPAGALAVGDIVEVRPGELIPADGNVLEGLSSLDTASITGESTPWEVSPGAEVFSGSLNLEGLLTLEITRIGEDTTLGRVVSLLQDAERAKPPVTRLLERYSQSYIVLVLVLAAGVWFTTGRSQTMLAVLVASCPCALILAAPATAIAAISVASRLGILVKGAAFLETLATVDCVALDKTGTVTTGQMRLARAEPAPGVTADSLLSLAGELGAASNHPVSQALATVAGDQARDQGDLTDIRETHGLGVTARKGDDVVALGRKALFDSLGIRTTAAPLHDGPVAGVSKGKRFLGWLLLADRARPEAREALEDLAGLGLHRQILITGDRLSTATRVAEELDIAVVYAELLPAEKMSRITEEIAAGRRPLVVGDGVNDALALKAGAVGIAMGGRGADVALASADLVLMRNDLRLVATCIRLSRRCRSTIYANVAISLAWTALIVSLAIGGLLGSHGALAAAVLQNASSIVVMFNAGRLLKFQTLPAFAG